MELYSQVSSAIWRGLLRSNVGNPPTRGMSYNMSLILDYRDWEKRAAGVIM